MCKGAVTVSAHSAGHGVVTHRKIKFAVNVSKEHDVQSHMFKPTITDMQDKYCGNCYDSYLIQSQYKGNHKRGGAAEGHVTSFVVEAAGRHLCISVQGGLPRYCSEKRQSWVTPVIDESGPLPS